MMEIMVNGLTEEEISLSKKFYPADCVDRAMIDFSGVCVIKMNESKNYYHIRMTDKSVAREFCNYALSLAKMKRVI